MHVKDGFTADSLFGGRIRCTQRIGGYRFSLDAVLLGNFIKISRGDQILDLGCGSGIISLILAYRWHDCLFTGLELQQPLVDLAKKNVADNNLQERIEIVPGDLRHIEKLLPAGKFDWIICNPPYRKTGTGRQNLEAEQLAARHETMADVAAVVKAAAWALRNKGRAAFVYPAVRGATILHELKNYGLEPKRMQVVYSYPGSAATLLLVESIKGGGEELSILSPFYIYKERQGEYSAEMEGCYRG